MLPLRTWFLLQVNGEKLLRAWWRWGVGKSYRPATQGEEGKCRIDTRLLGQFHETRRASKETGGKPPDISQIHRVIASPHASPRSQSPSQSMRMASNRVVRAAGEEKSVAAADGKSVVLPRDAWMHARSQHTPRRKSWVFAGAAEPTTFLSRSPLSDWADPTPSFATSRGPISLFQLHRQKNMTGKGRGLGSLHGLSQLWRATRQIPF